jgi:hypothetical protein
MRTRRLIAVAGVMMTLAACTMGPTPARTQAAAVAQGCGGQARTLQALAPTDVQRVEPLYAVLDSTPNGMESRLIGAKLYLKAIDGATAETIRQALLCNAAKGVLEGPHDGCPGVVPNASVDVEVTASGAGYVASLRGRDIDEGKEILARAKAFACG